MKQQTFKNHTRLVPAYHGVTGIAMLLLLVGAIINLCYASAENVSGAWLLVLISVILLLLFWFVRAFALKAQDRAIRAEESLRYFILTSKPLPADLRISQIIALRFAPDEEFLSLVTRSVNENLSPKEIKQDIKNWRADHHRA